MKLVPSQDAVLLAASFALILMGLPPVLVSPRETLIGWLTFWVVASAVVLGGLFFVLLADIIPGAWRQTVRPGAAALGRWTPLLALGLAPVVLGIEIVFPWTDDETLTGFRGAYLSAPFFVARMILGLLVLTYLSLRLASRPSRSFAIGGLIVFMLVQNFLATDLVLSLDPEFHSSGFGLYLLSVQALTGFAALIWLRLGREEGGREERRMLGALLLVMLLSWAYFDFMQYFILWSGNLPSRAQWFLRRGAGVWHGLSVIAVWLRLIPAFLLLFAPLRRDRRWLLLFSAATMVGTVMEVAWLIFPQLDDHGWAIFAFLAPLGGLLLLAGGQWMRAANREAAQ